MGLNDLFKNAEGTRAKIDAASNAAQNGVLETEQSTPEYVSDCWLTKDSSKSEILDYIMYYLCTNIREVPNAFKGGYVLTKIIPEYARATRDIDFSISDEKQYELVKEVMRNLISVLIKVGCIESGVVKETIQEHCSGGMTIYPVNANEKAMGIDVGLHDISYGIQSWNINGFDVNRFEVERMLSDKIKAIYSKKRFRRAKDLYDFFILTNCFDVDIKKWREYTLQNDGIDWESTPFREDRLIEYAKAYDTLQVTDVETGIQKSKPTFEQCINRIDVFSQVFNFDKFWNHTTGVFEDEK